MFIKTLLNRIERFKSFVYRRVVLETVAGEERLVVYLKARKNSKPLYSGCGRPAPRYDLRAKPRLFDYVPIWGIPVFFSYRMRRVNCPQCGVATEEVPWARGKSRITRTFSIFLARWARRLSWSETASVFKTSWESVYRSVQWVVQWGLEHRDLHGITAIGVDELHVGNRQFITILYQIDEGMRRILGIAPGKSKESMQELIEELGEHVASIRFVCSDMSQAYRLVVHLKARKNSKPLCSGSRCGWRTAYTYFGCCLCSLTIGGRGSNKLNFFDHVTFINLHVNLNSWTESDLVVVHSLYCGVSPIKQGN